MSTSSTAIASLSAREILDSRGNPTLEVEVSLSGGAHGVAAVPSGASTGTHEALELRDHDAKRYGGKGVLRAVAHVTTEIAGAVRGMDAADLAAVDRRMCELDGTPNKSRLGANAILGASLGCAHAVAAARKEPLFRVIAQWASAGRPPLLPVPLMNIVNGGVHADSGLACQEFMIVPWGRPTFAEALRAGAEVFHALKAALKKAGHSVAVGDEGGFAPRLETTEQALAAVVDAIGAAGYRAGADVALALDPAASEFYDAKTERYRIDGRDLSSGDLVHYWKDLAARFPIVSIEDGMAEDDWTGWERLTAELGSRIQIVGDDLFATNPARLRKGIERRAANAILIKLNQIGTVTETLETMRIAAAAGFASVVSHRSGETEDTTIADLAAGTGCGQIKTGSVCRSERVAKYNRLLGIEKQLGGEARYAGRESLRAQSVAR